MSHKECHSKFFSLCCALRTLASSPCAGATGSHHTLPSGPRRPGSGYWSSFFLNQVMAVDLMHLLPETLPPQLLLILPLWAIITFLGNMTFLTCLLPTLPHF